MLRRLRRERLRELLLVQAVFCFSVPLAASASSWSAADSIDIREVSEIDSVEFRPVEIPDKFVTGSASRDGMRAVADGLVTYRWVPNVPDCSVMGATIATTGTAWSLGYVKNGKWQLLGEVGVVSRDPARAIAKESPKVVSLKTLPKGPCILFLLVSNHAYGHGGLWRAPSLGLLADAEAEYRRGRTVATLVFSMLLLAGLYHLVLGLLKGHDDASRYFAWLSLVLALRQGASGFGVLDAWVSRDASWSFSTFQHLAFLSMPLVPCLLNRYIHSLFSDLLSLRLQKWTDRIFGLFVLYWLLAPVAYFDRGLLPFHFCVVAYSLSILGRFLLRLKGSDWMLRAWVLSAFFLIVGAFIDIAMVQLGFGQQYVLAYGFVGFIGTQSYLIARRFDGYLAESRELAASLQVSLDERTKVEGQLHDVEAKLEVNAEELRVTGQMLIQSQKLAGLGELVASIGHDIGNPLHSLQLGLETRASRERAILDAIESILDQSEDAIAFRGHIMPYFEGLRSERGTAKLSLERLNALSMALRRSARLDAEIELFDLHQVMKDSLLITSHRLKLHELDVEMDSFGVLLGHASHIGQVFTNLLTNAADALDAREEGAGKIRIRIFDRELEGNAFIAVTVEDSGAGIPDELKDKVTEIFFTTKPSGKGTGLGLAITRRILDEHQGTMQVGHSALLGGAEIALLFPRRDEVRTLSPSPVSSEG